MNWRIFPEYFLLEKLSIYSWIDFLLVSSRCSLDFFKNESPLTGESSLSFSQSILLWMSKLPFLSAFAVWVRLFSSFFEKDRFLLWEPSCWMLFYVAFFSRENWFIDDKSSLRPTGAAILLGECFLLIDTNPIYPMVRLSSLSLMCRLMFYNLLTCLTASSSG